MTSCEFGQFLTPCHALMPYALLSQNALPPLCVMVFMNDLLAEMRFECDTQIVRIFMASTKGYTVTT